MFYHDEMTIFQIPPFLQVAKFIKFQIFVILKVTT